jgi:hypothetical protein
MSFRAPLLCLLVSICAFPFGSMAADADPAGRFVELLRYGEQFRLQRENCLRQADTLAFSRAYSAQLPMARGDFDRRARAIFENSARPAAK